MNIPGCFAALLVCACSSGDTTPPADLGQRDAAPCRLVIKSISGEEAWRLEQLGPSLDRDPTTPSYEIDVEVEQSGAAPDAAAISLEVSGVAEPPTAKLDGARARFATISVDPESTPIVTLRPRAEGCEGQALNLSALPRPRCTITAPADGARLVARDDEIPGNATFEADVTVAAIHAALVELRVGGTLVGGPVAPDALGQATFAAVTLPPTADGRSVLVATVRAGSLSADCQAAITVDDARPACALAGYAPPALVTDKGDALGAAQDRDPAKPLLQTELTVLTTGDRVALLVDGVAHAGGAKAPLADGKASFALDLAPGQVNVWARCEQTTLGSVSETPQRSVIVDTIAPPAISGFSCALTHRRRREISCSYEVPDDGPDGSGVQRCLVAYRSLAPVTASSFDVSPSKAQAVGVEDAATTVVDGLELQTPYYFAARCYDLLGHATPMAAPPVSNGGISAELLQAQRVGGEPGARFGERLAAGDFNCDGLADLAVAAPRANAERGEVQLFFGDGKGLPATFSSRVVGAVAGGRLGGALAALDHNGDGCSDLAVSTVPLASVNAPARAYLYLGRTVWDERSTDAAASTRAPADVVFTPPSGSSDRLGGALAAGDFDGDGAVDLALACQTGGAARVLVSYGDAARKPLAAGGKAELVELPAKAGLTIKGALTTEQFGEVLASGDLDGDGAAELAIGAPATAPSGLPRGAAYVIAGGPRSTTSIIISTSTRVTRILGGSGNSTFGSHLAMVGDVDGNGVAELAISDPAASGKADGAGRLYLFELTPQGNKPTTVADAKRTVVSDLPGAPLGPVTGGLLYAGDTQAALVLVSSGAVRAFRGRAGLLGVSLLASKADAVVTLLTATADLGADLSLGADYNGDGAVDLIVSDPAHAGAQGRLVLIY